ncbi:SMP-30/gluconolactonase/LRE family protein [Rhodococcus triatomae]
MTLSRVAMVGAVLLGVVAGTPLAAAQSVPVTPSAPVTPPPGPPVEPMPMPTVVPGAPLSSDVPALLRSAPVVETVPAAEAAPASTPAAAPESTAPANPPACVPWKVSTVADGFGVLENLAFDGDGTMLLSESIPFGDGAIRTLTPSGEAGTLVSDVQSPGGIVVDGDRVVFTTGNNVMAGLWGSANGTVDAVDRDGGNHTTLTEGLSMPNGLALLDGGDLLVTHAFGDEPGLTRIPASDPTSAATVRTDVGSANGLFSTPTSVYVGNTVDRSTEVHVLDAGDLTGEVTTLTLPGGGAANAGDDLTVDADGLVYIALNGAGKVVRVDPATGDTCEIATDLPMTSSVRFGSGTGWDSTSLYATSFAGTVHRLTPPGN